MPRYQLGWYWGDFEGPSVPDVVICGPQIDRLKRGDRRLGILDRTRCRCDVALYYRE